jgi:excisionase family DNA binding protein
MRAEDPAEPDERLETARQLAKRVGISEQKVRYLLKTKQLEHVMIGSRAHIPKGAFSRFLAARTVAPCPDETKAQSCVGSRSVTVSTSPGLNTVAAASAQLARQTAEKLKSLSQNGSSKDSDGMAPVIQLRS